MYGRRVIYTDEEHITGENLLSVLAEALPVHLKNAAEIRRLWDIYRGKTAILQKTKEVRPEINHRICENRAYEIVNFYTGYVFGEPIQYVHQGGCGRDGDVLELNRAMRLAGKEARDAELAEWLYVAGIGHRLVLGDRKPVGVYTMDSGCTFCVHWSGHDRRVVLGVTYVQRQDGTCVLTCYTEDHVYTVRTARGLAALAGTWGEVTGEPHYLGQIPIIEYIPNSARMGVFEPAIPLMEALDELQSSRMDDVAATVNSILVLVGASMEEGQYKQLQEEKMMSIPNGSDAMYLNCPLNQEGVQIQKEDLYQSILTICGLPNRNGGASTSDTGAAVMLRDGWQSAEARAKHTESLFRESERAFLALALTILQKTGTLTGELNAEEIVVKFTRRNYDNLQTKVQALTEMLSSEHIHPETAFVSCGLFVDPIGEYRKGEKWREEHHAGDDPVSPVSSDADESRGTSGSEVPQM